MKAPTIAVVRRVLYREHREWASIYLRTDDPVGKAQALGGMVALTIVATKLTGGDLKPDHRIIKREGR